MLDWVRYGRFIRARRKARRLAAREVQAAVESRLQGSLERDFLFRVEGAARRPTVEQFLAINYVLWGNPAPQEVMLDCLKGQPLIDYHTQLTKGSNNEYPCPDPR